MIMTFFLGGGGRGGEDGDIADEFVTSNLALQNVNG
jgi:hypothetical protein